MFMKSTYEKFWGKLYMWGKPTRKSQTISNEQGTSAKCLQTANFLEDVRELPN